MAASSTAGWTNTTPKKAVVRNADMSGEYVASMSFLSRCGIRIVRTIVKARAIWIVVTFRNVSHHPIHMHPDQVMIKKRY